MPTFLGALLETYNTSGLSWVQTVGCFYVIYGFLISTKKTLWKVLLVHGITGLLGSLLENIFLANNIANPGSNLAWILLLNEVNWILNESSTVVYSMIKLEAVITSPLVKKTIRFLMGALFIIYAVCRIYIGILRMRFNTTMNPSIESAHSYAFLPWGVADLVLLGLLVQNTVEQVHSNALRQSKAISSSILKSSLPRFLIIVITTGGIVVLGQVAQNSTIRDISTFFWLLKGTYPLILLFDIQTTKSMLRAAQSSMSTTTGNNTNESPPPSANDNRISVFTGRFDDNNYGNPYAKTAQHNNKY